jgi:hypothetical protein
MLALACVCENSPDDSVGAFTDYILDVVLLRHVEGNLPGATASCGRHVCGWCMGKRCALLQSGRGASAWVRGAGGVWWGSTMRSNVNGQAGRLDAALVSKELRGWKRVFAEENMCLGASSQVW